MGKQHDDIIGLLEEIRDNVEALHVRIDESENNMLEVTGSISADLRRIIKKADIKKKRKKREKPGRMFETPEGDWPIVDADGVIQESDQKD